MKSRRIAGPLFLLLIIVSFGMWLHGAVPDVPTGQWLPGPALAQPRAGAVSVALDDGRVLVIGGRTANGPVDTVEVFNTNGTMSLGAQMLSPRSSHTATKLPDGRVLVVGGTTLVTTEGENGPVSSEAATASAELFDPVANAWYPAASLSVARSGATATALADGHVVVAGGAGGAGAVLDTFEVFDLESGAFSAPGVLWAARAEHAAAVAGASKVIVAGGRNAGGVLASADIIDVSDGSVAPVVLTVPRAGASATALLDGKILVAGGSDGNQELASAEVVDPLTGVSAITGSMAQARRDHQALLLANNNTVLITGGRSGGAVVAGAEQFIAWSETFVSTGAPASARDAAVVSSLPGAAGVALRADNDGASASTELYGFATLQTDSDDYAPGTTVLVTGSGWQPGETVTLVLHEVATGHADRTYTAVADGAGRISNTGFTPDQQHLGVRFYLTARGAASQAQATFTDGQPSTVTMTPNTRSVAPGGSATYPISVVFGGNATPCTVSLSVTPSIGTGITASFDTTSLIGAGNETRSAQLTLATTISGPPADRTPVGSYPFTLTVTRVANCQGNGTLTASGTLIVYGAAANLEFNQQPTNSTGGSAVTPAVTVRVLDANNNVVGNSGAPITLAIGNNPAAGALSGALTANAINGVATFAGLSIDKVGSGYTLAATSTGLTSATSAAFNITVGPPAQVRVETTVNGTGTVVPAQNVASASSMTVYAIRRDAGGNFIDNVAADTWSLVGITGGALPGDLNPAGNKKSAVFTGNAAGSAAIRATVATLTSIDSGTLTVPSTSVNTTTAVSSSLSPSLFGQSVSFTATVSPASGTTPPTGSVQFVVDGDNLGSAVTLSPSGSNGVATSLSTAALTVLGLPHSVTAQYLPTGSFNTSSGALAGGQTVNKANQVVTVTQSAPATAVYNTSFPVSATGGSSGNPVVIASSGACTGGGNNSAAITMGSGTGTCTVTFNQIGDANYNAAPQVSQSTTAQKANQVITVVTPAPSDAEYHASFTVAATGGGSGNPVTYTSAGVCSVVGAVFTMTSGTGTCTVKYDQAGDANYDPAPQVTASVTATKASQAITVTTSAPASAIYNTSFTVAATGGGSGTPVTFSNGGVCSNVGAVFTMTTGTGTCTVHYDQAGDSNYNAAPQVTATVTAQKADQTITVTTPAPASAVYDTSFTVAATGGASGNPVTYSAAGVCSSVEATFTMTSGTGTCTVHYDQAGDSNYNAAPQVTATVTAQKADQTITVTTPAPASAVYDTSFTVAATGGASGNPVTYSAAGVCSSVEATFTMTSGTGSCTVKYDQAGDANYDAAPQVTESVNAVKASQAITVTTHAPSNAVYDTIFTVAATPASGLPVSYSSDGVCSVVGATYTMTSGLGTCTVKYDQTGNDNYNPAPQVTESVTAQKANQTITVTTHAPAMAVYNTGFTVAATGGGSGNPVTFGGAGVCSNLAATFTMTSGTGACTVIYDQAGNDNYNAAAQVTETVTAQKANQTIVVTTAAPAAAVYNTSFTVAATGGASGNPVTFGAAGVCSNVAAIFTMTSGTGTCTVKYDQAGDGNYNAASQIIASVTAQQADQTITFAALANKIFGDVPFTVSATASSDLPVSFSSQTPTICGVSGNTVTILLAGTCTLRATQAGNSNYNAAPAVDRSFTVDAWTLTGFYQPATMGGVYNTVKGGSTIPLKFNIYQGATGTNERTAVAAIKSFQYGQTACAAGMPDDPVDVVTTGGTSLRYSTTAHQFIQNWQTPKPANQCYAVVMTTQDGSTLVAYFKTK